MPALPWKARGVKSEEEAVEKFFAFINSGLKKHSRDEFKIHNVKPGMEKDVWVVLYEELAPTKATPSADLPNAKDCDACKAFDVARNDCATGGRPATCGHKVEIKAKPAEVKEASTPPILEGEQAVQVKLADIVLGRNARQRFDKDKIRELADDIALNGQQSPALGRRKGKRIELYSGGRRFRAMQALGHETISMIIRDVSDEQVLFAGLADNNHEPLSEVEEADYYAVIIDELKISQAELARRIGKSQPHVNERLRLTSAPREIREWAIERSIGPTTAIDLLQQANKPFYGTLLDLIRERIKSQGDLRSRELRGMISVLEKSAPAPSAPAALPEPTKAAEEEGESAEIPPEVETKADTEAESETIAPERRTCPTCGGKGWVF